LHKLFLLLFSIKIQSISTFISARLIFKTRASLSNLVHST
jgi:hypothetical protein